MLEKISYSVIIQKPCKKCGLMMEYIFERLEYICPIIFMMPIDWMRGKRVINLLLESSDLVCLYCNWEKLLWK